MNSLKRVYRWFHKLPKRIQDSVYFSMSVVGFVSTMFTVLGVSLENLNANLWLQIGVIILSAVVLAMGYYVVMEHKATTTQGAENTESSADICFEVIKAEYDYCVTRAEKLENKVYILLAVCAFVFVLLTTQIEKTGELGMPQSRSELLGIIIYVILLAVAVISNVGMLVMTVRLLKSVRFERLNSGLLLAEGVPDEKDTTAVRFIGRLYVQHTVNINAVLPNIFC